MHANGNGRSASAVLVASRAASLPSTVVRDLDIRQGAIGRVDAEDVAVVQGAVGAARGDRVSVEFGAVGAALGGDVRVSRAAVGAVVARRVLLEQAFARTVVAQEVVVRRPSAIVFLVAQRVQGDVKVLFDWRAGLALGAALALIGRLIRRR